MISFTLRCAKEHLFEAWFPDGKTFERQARTGKVTCPICGSSKVVKAPMAPRIAKTTRKSARSPEAEKRAAMAREAAQALGRLRQQIEKNCDYVGGRFAEEARKIHYGETEKRNIYGETSSEEARSLNEEGVEFYRVPWPVRTDS